MYPRLSKRYRVILRLVACEPWATTNTLFLGNMLGVGFAPPLADWAAAPLASEPAHAAVPTPSSADGDVGYAPIDLRVGVADPFGSGNERRTQSADGPAVTAGGVPTAPDGTVPASPFGLFVGVFGDSTTGLPDSSAPATPAPQSAPGTPMSGAAVAPAPAGPPSAPPIPNAGSAPATGGAGANAAASALPPRTTAPANKAAPATGPHAATKSAVSQPSGSGGATPLDGGSGGSADYSGVYDAPITETSILIAGDGSEVQVTATVTFETDHFQWDYNVQNINYVGEGGGVDWTNVGRFHVEGGVAGEADITNSLGWYQFGTSWVGDKTLPLLAPGDSGYFSFTTPLCAIGHVGAEASELEYNMIAGGEVLGPVPNTAWVTAGVSKYIPINANNDNNTLVDGSPWKPVEINNVVTYEQGIPNVRDFKAGVEPHDDMELKPLTITFAGNGGRIDISADGGFGQVKLWDDRRKAQAIKPFDLWKLQGGMFTVYVEGVSQSSSPDDVTIHVVYTDLNGGRARWDQTVTVTPIVKSLSVTPGGQNVINYTNGVDVTAGLSAALANGQPGALFKADVLDAAVSMDYVQNISYSNGGHGTGAGWTYKFPQFQQAPQNMRSADVPDTQVPFPGPGVPGLDGNPKTVPFYEYNLDTTKPSPTWQDGHIISDNDSPATGFPSVFYNNATSSVDLRYDYTLYLVVRYDDDSYWPVANITWHADFYAAWVAAQQKVVILNRNGVTAGAAWIENTEPVCSHPPLFNASNYWG